MRKPSEKYPLGKHTSETYTCSLTGITRLKRELCDDMLTQQEQERILKQEILEHVSLYKCHVFVEN